MKICLEEIGRCQRVTPRPNSVVLLGDRYGWRPLPAEIPVDEFEEILHCLPIDETERQRRHALLTQWYRRDDNAVPAVYCLLPREGECTDFNKWEAVERELRSVLLEAIAGTSLALEKRLKYTASATEQEKASHENFGEDRAKFFIGRAGILQTIANYVKGGDRHPLVVHGASGVGKSALMACAVEQARKDHPSAEIIVRFIGATSGSSDGRALLESLYCQISRRYGADEYTVPQDPKELVQEFPKWLA